MAIGATAAINASELPPRVLNRLPSTLCIQFQCPHCATLLQISREQSGLEGPCPVCFHVIASPALAIPRPPADRPKLSRDKPIGVGTVTGSRALSGRSLTRPEKKRLNARGVMADQSIHHENERKKELLQERRMLIWCLLVFLLLAASTYVMKSLVAGR